VAVLCCHQLYPGTHPSLLLYACTVQCSVYQTKVCTDWCSAVYNIVL
jgi:hypothetical protein